MTRIQKYNSYQNSPRIPELYSTHKVLFDCYGEYTTLKYFLNDKTDHMVFFHDVTELIDENIFDPLYPVSKGPGKPAYSPRVLVAFMIFCESNRISPTNALENLKRSVVLKLAFGLNCNSDVFCYKTYYNFRRRLTEYYEVTGIDLYEEAFRKVTQKQVQKYGVEASHVRMDSKYFDSNIKVMSRYEIMLSTLQVVLKRHPFNFSETLQKEVDNHLKERGEKTMYALKNGKATFTEILTNLGSVVYRAICELLEYESVRSAHLNDYKSQYSLLYRVFEEQYDMVGGKPVPKDGRAIPPDSVQNPYDPEAAYREKNGNVYRGYAFFAYETFGNLTAPNLVLDYQVDKATASDQASYIKGIEGCEKTSLQNVMKTASDFAFTSDENRAFNLTHLENSNLRNEDGSTPFIEQWVGTMGGRLPQFDLIEYEDKLKVYDRKTDKEYIAERVKDKIQRDGKHIKRWTATVEKPDGQLVKKLFTEEELRKANRRREIENMPIEQIFCRNNVEATMFQAGYTTNGCQTRFRGLYKHKLFFGARVMWMNYRRILLFLQRKDKMAKKETSRAAI